jgi:predicted acylesterase/phospholipase RssA
MGNATAKEAAERKLIVKNRLLQNQVDNMDHINAVVKHDISDVKKNRRYTNLVLSGGAVKGYALVGVLEYLDTHHYLNNICNIACSSMGSIFAVLYAIGYTVPEIKQIAESPSLDPHKLTSTNKDLASDIFHVATEYGHNNGQYLIDTISDLIEKRTSNRHYTLEHLWKEKGINLVITGTDVTTGSTIYFWHGKYPRMPLRLLVRIACSIPGIICPVIFDGHYLVDGGLLMDTPIHVFDGGSGSGSDVSPHTLAVALIGDLNTNAGPDEQGDVSLQSLHGNSVTHNIVSIGSYYTALLDSLVYISRSQVVRNPPSYWLRTIPVHVPNYQSYQMKMSKQDIYNMFVYGWESTRDFFEE